MNKATADQISSVMLQHGTPRQQEEALRYCSRFNDPDDPGAHHPGCPTPGGCSEHGCHGACLPATDGVLIRAADMLTAYAELIRRDGASHVEEHHYLPEVEFMAQELRNRAALPNTNSGTATVA